MTATPHTRTSFCSLGSRLFFAGFVPDGERLNQPERNTRQEHRSHRVLDKNRPGGVFYSDSFIAFFSE